MSGSTSSMRFAASWSPNIASLRLHEHHGFRTVGIRERIALMTYGPLAGTWRDTILIERRHRNDSV